MKLKEITNPDVTINNIEDKVGITTQRGNELLRSAHEAIESFTSEAMRQETARSGERANTKYKRLFTASPVNYISALMQDTEWETPHELVFVLFHGMQTYMNNIIVPQLQGDNTLPHIIEMLESFDNGKRTPMAKGGDA